VIIRIKLAVSTAAVAAALYRLRSQGRRGCGTAPAAQDGARARRPRASVADHLLCRGEPTWLAIGRSMVEERRPAIAPLERQAGAHPPPALRPQPIPARQQLPRRNSKLNPNDHDQPLSTFH